MRAPEENNAPAAGEVITFYSYKGGTGRSMLLANVAWLLASAGKRVLMIDFDLEAPGLHRYFKPFLGDDIEMREQPGVLEWVTDYWEARIDDPEAPIEDLVARDADPRRYVRPLQTQGFLFGGSLDLMCAGRQDRHYAQAVADFDWTRLYERLDGEGFIEVAKQMLVGPGGYDVVLIDSRTGVSDTSGFCTVALADTLVVCFTYNNQSVIGASNAARNILQQAQALRRRPPRPGCAARRRFRLFAVPSRVDDLDRERLERREQQAWGLFDDLLTDVAADQRTAYWGAVAIRNHGQFAYEEVLAACMNRPTDTQSMLGSVCNLVRELTSGAFTQPNPLTDDQRRQLRELFAAQGAAGMDPTRDRRAWATVLARLPEAPARDALLESCFALLIQLYTLAPPPERQTTESAEFVLRVALPEQHLSSAERQMAEQLTAAGVTQRRMTQDGQRALMVTDDSLLAQWTSLRERLLECVSFLSARDRVAKARSSWEAAGSSIDALRSLAGEVAGLDFNDEQGAWLGRPNLQFLAAIRAVRGSQERESKLSEELLAEQESQRGARAEWAALRERLEQDYGERLQRVADEAQGRELRIGQRARNASVVAVVMGLLAVSLPLLSLRMALGQRQEIEASRDEAIKANALARAQLAEFEKQRQDARAQLAYGQGYRHMTVVPARERRYDLAVASFNDAIEADPAFAEAYQGRAVARSLSADADKPAEIIDWAHFFDLRPSLNRRSKFLAWALLTPGADAVLLKEQLAKLPLDAREAASRDVTPSVAAGRISALSDRLPGELRAAAERSVAALRSTNDGLAPAKPVQESAAATRPAKVAAVAGRPDKTPALGPAPSRSVEAAPPAAAPVAVAAPAPAQAPAPSPVVVNEPNTGAARAGMSSAAQVPLPAPDDVAATRRLKSRGLEYDPYADPARAAAKK